MFHSQVSSKGQVVIPKPLRDRLGIAEGATVAFAEDAQGLRLSVVTQPTREDIRQSLRAGHGLAGYRGPAHTPAEMRAGVRAAFRRGKR
ncbi:MAG: AbrB/MazE/SpoVT family DNA-binding domain-containing protein [Pseudomonadota bacterium]